MCALIFWNHDCDLLTPPLQPFSSSQLVLDDWLSHWLDALGPSPPTADEFSQSGFLRYTNQVIPCYHEPISGLSHSTLISVFPPSCHWLRLFFFIWIQLKAFFSCWSSTVETLLLCRFTFIAHLTAHFLWWEFCYYSYSFALFRRRDISQAFYCFSLAQDTLLCW